MPKLPKLTAPACRSSAFATNKSLAAATSNSPPVTVKSVTVLVAAVNVPASTRTLCNGFAPVAIRAVLDVTTQSNAPADTPPVASKSPIATSANNVTVPVDKRANGKETALPAKLAPPSNPTRPPFDVTANASSCVHTPNTLTWLALVSSAN